MTSRIDTNWSIAFASPNYTITYASTYGAETVNADAATIVASTRNADVILINDTALRYSKCTSPSEASRAALISAISALNVAPVTTPDNHYVITTKDEFDTAITDATAAAVPYRFEIAAGTYAFTSAVAFPPNGEITGAGREVTILTNSVTPAAGAGQFLVDVDTTVRDLTFNGLDTSDGSFNGNVLCEDTAAGELIAFENVEITRSWGAGLRIVDCDGRIEVRNCRFTDGEGSNTTAIYAAAGSASGTVLVHDTYFNETEYCIYLDNTVNVDIQRCSFERASAGGNSVVYTKSSATARTIVCLNLNTVNWTGPIDMPTSYGSLTGFYVDLPTHSGGVGTYVGIQRIGEERRDSQTSNLDYNNTQPWTVNACSLTDLIPGTYTISYRAKITDTGSQGTAAVVLDNTADAGEDIPVGTSAYTDAIIETSQSAQNQGTGIADDCTRVFTYTNTAVNDIHLVFGNRIASASTGLQCEFTGGLATVGDNEAYLSAIRIS